MKIWKKLARITAHVLFWGIVLYRFLNNSFLRPFCFQHPEREIFCVFLIMGMVYLHYFLFIPFLFQKGRKTLYWIISFSSILLITIVEFVITYQTTNFFVTSAKLDNPLEYYQSITFLIFMRNTCFFAFFFLLKLYEQLKASSLKEKKAFSQQKDSIVVSTSLKDSTIVNIDDITFFSHQRNYTTIHLLSGDSFKQYTPLKEFHELLPPNTGLQISRNCIVMLKHVIGYNSIYIRIRTGENEQMDIIIPVRRKQEIVSLLENLGTPKINIAAPSEFNVQ